MFTQHSRAVIRRFSSKPELSPLPRAHDARFVEGRWYDWWRSQKFFDPESPATSTGPQDNFTIILPPPNVTGSLHLGHALTIAIEDAFVRYHRMQGRRVLWIPGLDHAGIATQVQVEKDLWAKRKLTRHDVGREEFLRCAEIWKDEKSQRIKSQIRRLGANVVWDRLVFTLDDQIQHGVREAFIRLQEDGKIYRQERLVNWCGHLQSTISDIEVEHREIPEPTKIRVPGEKDPVEVGFLSQFAYPVLDSPSGEEIVVATTRLETMIGDTAVAVHPDDERFKHLHGRQLRHPLLDYPLPIILDSSVNRSIGTGAVKITPAHDYKDFETGIRHSLPSRRVIDDTGRMISTHPDLAGLSRFTARKVVESMLRERNLWRGLISHQTVVPLCSRSGDVIEPQLKKQWFLRCESYTKKAREVVANGQLRIVPPGFAKQWDQWLTEDKDWCLSRQLWWGQRIPAYSTVIDGEEKWVSAHSEENARLKLQTLLKGNIAVDSLAIQQDTDVLDTWFTSSALPFLVFGWPNQSADYSTHYPLSLMETGHDILLFWVARMVMLGLALTDQVPFKTVLLHGLITDKNGKKMSKSTGNVIDPMEILYDVHASLAAGPKKTGKLEIGSDALRFALCRYETQQHFVQVDLKHIEEASKFCNKIWQAFFLCSSAWERFPTEISVDQRIEPVSLLNRWILLCLLHLIIKCNAAMADLKLDVAVTSLHSFMLDDFCDVYLECTKSTLKDATDHAACLDISSTMQLVFNVILRLNSLFMPNLSEELYQRLPTVPTESVCIAPYPTKEDVPVPYEPDLHPNMRLIVEIARAAKNIRLQYGLLRERVPLYVVLSPDLATQLKMSWNRRALPEDTWLLSRGTRFTDFKDALMTLSRSSEVTILTHEQRDQVPANCVYDCAPCDVDLYVHMGDKFDLTKEKASLQSRLQKAQLEIEEMSLLPVRQYGQMQLSVTPVRRSDRLTDRLHELDRLCDSTPQAKKVE